MASILAIDLTNTRNRLYVKKNWHMNRIDKAIESYRRFLYLCVAFPKESFAPTEEVDEVWHDHILHTKQYIGDCMTIAGEVIHHNPFPTEISEKFGEKTPRENNPNFTTYCLQIWGESPVGLHSQTCDKCTKTAPELALAQTCDKCTKTAPELALAQTCDNPRCSN